MFWINDADRTFLEKWTQNSKIIQIMKLLVSWTKAHLQDTVQTVPNCLLNRLILITTADRDTLFGCLLIEIWYSLFHCEQEHVLNTLVYCVNVYLLKFFIVQRAQPWELFTDNGIMNVISLRDKKSPMVSSDIIRII